MRYFHIYFIYSYWKKPLTLHELLEEAEKLETSEIPDGIVIFPPENANDENTDEDSGEEDNVVLNNLPGSQLLAEAEFLEDFGTYGYMNENEAVEVENENETVEEENEIVAMEEVNKNEAQKEKWDSEDELPLSSFVQHKVKKIKKFNFTKADLDVNLSEWKPVLTPQNNLSPATLFKLFFSNEVIDDLVRFSNIYALQKNRAGDITYDEMLCFIGILILSGYSIVSRRKMYWQNSPDTHNSLVSSGISRDRFQYIMSNIHCCDNGDLDKNDRFAKVRPLFQALNKKFFDYAPTEENHSVDEAMVPYFGRQNCKQFIKGKPIRWGYKLWVGATRLGYIVYFEPYQGSSTKLPEQYKELGLGASVVLQYADILESTGYQNYHMFFDNFFTSLSLLKELQFRGIKATGTVRENRINNCPLINSKNIKKKERGFFDYALADSEIIICRWNDNNVTTIASNAASVFPLNRAKRFSQKEKKHLYIEQPRLIKLYNENMGGVDRSDQNIAQYRISIRGKKWYFPLISHTIDMAVQNSWHLHRKNGGKQDQLSFRRAIATELLETYKRTTKRGPSKYPQNHREHSRYDRIDHLVIYQEKQCRCALCHKKVNFRCAKCDVGLHPKECFLLYHTK